MALTADSDDLLDEGWLAPGCAPVVLVVLVLILGFYLSVIRPNQRDMAWNRGIERRICRLAEYKPDDLTEGQWAACLYFSWQLHSNFGGAYYWDGTDRDAILAEFDRRLAAGADLGTIDWFWDQYALHTTGGLRYSRNARPTTRERLKAFAVGANGEFDLERWRQRASRAGR